MLWITIGLLISYLIGSTPTAYIFVRLLRGQDIRTIGSGNVGATNAWRVLGRPWGITVLIVDILKGFVVVYFLGNFLLSKTGAAANEMLRLLLGISAILGHSWTIFLNFKGGKGVATTLGVVAGLSITLPALRLTVALVFLTWIIVFAISRIVSLASVIACASFPFYMLAAKQSLSIIITTSLISLFIIYRHKNNIARLLQGKEKRLF